MIHVTNNILDGLAGPAGSQGIPGPQGAASTVPGPQGSAGADGDPLDFLTVPSNIVPTTTNTYTLGTPTKKWADIYIGPNTINIVDQTLLTNATLAVDNGILKLNGANQLQVGQLKFVNNTIESTTADINIEIGLLSSSADLIINRDLVIGTNKTITFSDATVQTTAAVAQVNSDWNATTGKAQILNKPTIPTAPATTSYASTLSSTNLAYSGTPTTAVYFENGKMVYVQIDVSLATVTNFGNNGVQYLLTLPFTAAHDSLLVGHCTIAGIVYDIAGRVTGGSNSIGLVYSISNGNGTANTFELFTKQKPVNMTTATTFQISGTYISQ